MVAFTNRLAVFTAGLVLLLPLLLAGLTLRPAQSRFSNIRPTAWDNSVAANLSGLQLARMPLDGQPRGRPKGSGGEIFVRGDDGQFRKRSWRDISPDASSSSGDGSMQEKATQHAQQVQSDTERPRVPASTHVDWADAGGGYDGQLEETVPVVQVYTHQLLSILEGCIPPTLPSGLDEVEELQESNFCMPGFDEKKGLLDFDTFAMPGLCKVPLEEGGTGVAYWCNCCPELELQKCIFSGCAHGRQESSFLDGQVPQCLHLEALLKLGQAVKLDSHDLCSQTSGGRREASEGTPVEERVVLLPFRGGAPKAALLGTTQSACVVVVEKSPGRWNCTECFGKGKSKCWHVQTVVGSHVPVDLSRLTAEQFEQQLEKDFDKTTGKRRLKCLSRLSIPEAHKADLGLTSLLLERGKGQIGFPTVCQVEAPAGGSCESCGRPFADSSTSEAAATIFHLLAPVQVQVQIRRCECGKVWHYDGRADGLLNFNNKYMYSYEILQWYANQMWRAKVPFVSMWRTVLSMYAAAGVDREALKLYVNQRQTFQDAFLDYITLLDIYYSESFRCTCSPPEGVAAADHEPTELIGDGITLGYRADLSYFVSPWKVDTAAELKTGSLHQNRTFVTDPRIRSALLQFAQPPGKAGAGLGENELEVLRVSLANSSAKRLSHLLESPQLRQDKFFCSEPSVEFLRAASVPQAAAILLPQSIEPIVEDLVSSEHRRFTDLDQVRRLAERAPVLGRFLQTRLAGAGNQLSEDDCSLLRDLLVVSRRSYIEEPIAAFKKLRKRKLESSPSGASRPGESRVKRVLRFVSSPVTCSQSVTSL